MSFLKENELLFKKHEKKPVKKEEPLTVEKIYSKK
jgi:hypothetical protein